MSEITENVKTLLSELKAGNALGEPVTLVAATKTQTADAINEALAAGIEDIGENRVQEFRDKYDLVHGGRRHFIGHLQTNKVKYLIGKTHLLHSLDREELAEEIQKRAERAGVVQDCLIEVNIGCELSKSGFSRENALFAYEAMKKYPNIRVRGLMAMLPLSDDRDFLRSLCLSMREIYDTIKVRDENICHLSMGMSGDWELCTQCGSNMIRLGTTLFGARRLPQTE